MGRGYPPAMLETTMWSHAPAPRSVMRRQGRQPAHLDRPDAPDLLASSSSSPCVATPPDAPPGSIAFSERRGAACHGRTATVAAGPPPVNKWRAIGDPIAFAESMWNHAGRMQQEFARRRIPWPDLTAQELVDMLVYLRNLPATRGVSANLQA